MGAVSGHAELQTRCSVIYGPLCHCGLYYIKIFLDQS